MLRNLNPVDRAVLKAVGTTSTTRKCPIWLAYIIVTIVVVGVQAIHVYAAGGLRVDPLPFAFLPFFFVILLSALCFNHYSGAYATLIAVLCASAAQGPPIAGETVIALKIHGLPSIGFIVTGFLISFVVESLNHLWDRHKIGHERSEVLIIDINHRVKNHLMQIAGLIHMSRKSVDDPTAASAMETVQGRILVLSRLYDRLRLDDANADVCVDARHFIPALCNDLAQSVIGERPVEIETQVEDFVIETAVAVPLGLLVNELVTNSLKHAFDEDGGTVYVNLHRDHAGDYILIVSDDGTREQPKNEAHRKKGTGTKVISSITKQLGGTLEVTSEPSHKTVIRLPAKK